MAGVPSREAWCELARMVVAELPERDQTLGWLIYDRIKSSLISRCEYGERGEEWIRLARAELARHRLDGIVVSEGEHAGNREVPSDIATLEETEVWANEGQVELEGDAQRMADDVEPLLRNAKEICIVDPWIRKEPRFEGALRKLFDAMLVGRCGDVPGRIEVQSVLKDSKRWRVSEEGFQRQMTDMLEQAAPAGWRVVVRRWEDHRDLHDRYILTPVGGVQLPRGTDVDSGSSSLIVLTDERFGRLWHDYAGHPPRYEPRQSFEVVGTRRLGRPWPPS